MRLGEGVEWALHCTTVLAFLPADGALPAARLAEYHAVPAAYLAKHLQALSRAGIVESARGPKGGYRLSRPPAEITLLEVVEAVEGPESSFRCTEIRQQGPTKCAPRSYSPVCAIAGVMREADMAWRDRLAQTSVGDIAAGVASDVSAEVAAKAAAWFEEVLT